MSYYLSVLRKAQNGGHLSKIEKATMTIGDLAANGGLLADEQANKFILLLIRESKLMPLVNVVPMSGPTRELSGVRMGGRILRPGVSATRIAEADRAEPTTSKVLLASKLFKGEVTLDDEVLEDNIERADFLNTVMAMIAGRVAVDMDDIILNGDTLSGDTTLAVLDGIRKQITSNLFDFTSQSMRPDLLTSVFKSLPTRYKRDRQNMRWLVSPNALEDYREVYAQRATDVGDANRTGLIDLMHAGTRIIDIPIMPENLGGGGNESELLLMNPKSAYVGIERAVKMETWRDPRIGETSIIVSIRMDVKVFEEAGAVKGQNVLAAA